MLRFVFTDVNDEIVTVENPLSVLINIEQDVPCDNLVATFPYISDKELKEVEVFDNDVVVFKGIVDEQQNICTALNEYTKVCCRSLCALLLDNESVPISYNQPSTDVIAYRHVYPFSIKYDEDKRTFLGVQTVLKGYSNYKVVEDFSKNVYGTTPRVGADGVLCFNRKSDDEVVVFSNENGCIPYISFNESIKRSEEISKVNIKVINSCGYNSVIKNEDAIKRGIIRERYINSVSSDMPADTALKMIEKGREKSYRVTVKCAGRHLDKILKKARVKSNKKDLKNLYICSIRYELKENGELTTLTLKREDVQNVAD